MADARDILGALAAQDEYSQPPDEAVFGRYPAPRTAVQYPAGSDTDGGGVNPAADFIRSVPRGMLGGLMGAATAGGEAEAHAMSQPDLAANIPSRDQAREAIEANVTGDLYRPQTRAGRYGETTGEVLGNPANWMAPGRLGAIVGWNVASGLGSEAAGQATEGTPYEKAARIAGSFGPMAAERALALAPGALAKIPGAFETAFNAVVPQNAAGAIIGGRLPSAKPPRIGDVADLSGLSTPGVTVGRPQPQGHRAANESIGPEGPTALDLARQEGYGGGEFTGSGKRGAAYLDDLIARLREDRGVPRVSEVPTLDRGPGQAPEAIRRTVDYRDPSGRPVRTAPLPIGTEEAILEQGFGMATGARPPGPHPPLMQAAERKGPVMGGVADLTTPSGIRAYHGSPHDFERFDINKIGTGEGAQSYGHGLYFAENEATAKSYRDALNSKTVAYNSAPANWNDPGTIAAAWLNNFGGDRAAAIKYLQGSKQPEIQEAHRMLERGDALPVRTGATGGRMYEVNINARPEQFLNWDAPLRGQQAAEKLPPPFVEAMKNEAYNRALTSTSKQRADELWGMVKNPYEAPGEFAIRAAKGDPSKASAALREAGIPGIKYLDQGSRFAVDPKLISDVQRRIAYANEIGASPEAMQKLAAELAGYQAKLAAQTSNYVLFDDKLIDILRKYGIAGMLGGGAAATMGSTARQDQYAQ